MNLDTRRRCPSCTVVSAATLVVVLFSLFAVTIRPAQARVDSAAEQLAHRFTPIAYHRVQSHSCDKKGEGYFPAPVEIVFGNPEVMLKQRHDGGSSLTDPVVKTGPVAQDLVGLSEDFYLDFPGNPRRATCHYESDFNRFVDELNAKPTAYARIVIDEAEAKLILQYWFWYYFNDWNNTHETDWEMIQLVFDVTSAEAALDQNPSLIGYAQHGGGELASWDDDKLETEDGRPVIFPAAGSHATYYGREQYIGWGENGTGFGCDNTTTPHNRVDLEVVLLPETPDTDGAFAWLLFDGRWGERQAWEFNGPFGPNAGEKWHSPLIAMENWRSSSLRIPSSNAIGPNATDAFCSLSAAGSSVLIAFGTHRSLLLAAVVAIVAFFISVFVSKRRELGAAIRLYRQHLRTFLGIGLWTIPIGIAFNASAFFVRENPPMDWVIKWFNDTANTRLFTAASIGGLQQISMVLIIAPPVLQAIKEIRAGRSPRLSNCFREGYRHIGPLLLGLLLVYVTIGLLFLLLVGIPFALWLSVRWQFFGQAIILDGALSGTEAVRRSAEAVRNKWWHALGQTLAFQIFAVLPGPLIGLALLVLGGTTVQFANALSSVVYAFTVPISLIGLTLAYERFKASRVDVSLSVAEAWTA